MAVFTVKKKLTELCIVLVWLMWMYVKSSSRFTMPGARALSTVPGDAARHFTARM